MIKMYIGIAMLMMGVVFTMDGMAGEKSQPEENTSMHSIYDFTVKDIDGNEVKLDRYKGNVVLIVNVASKCGFTSQYEGLQEIYAKYKELGFVVLGFPANNFLGQEPGTNEEIKQFCSAKYNVTFPMFSKISVKGKDIAPLYKFLTEKESNKEFAGDIGWNFNKFLVNREGRVVGRFDSRTRPDSEKMIRAIEQHLNAASDAK